MATLTRSIGKIVNIYYVVAVAVVLLQMSGRFLTGTWLPSTWLSLLLGLASPFAVIVSVGTLLQVNFRRFTERRTRDDVVVSGVFFVVFFVWIVLTFGAGVESDLYWYIHDILYRHAFLSSMTICALSLMMLTVRYLRPKNLSNAYMVFITVLAFMMTTPIGDILWPPIVDVAMFFLLYPGAVGMQLLWFGTYIGLMIVVLRVLLGKQRLRATAE